MMVGRMMSCALWLFLSTFAAYGETAATQGERAPRNQVGAENSGTFYYYRTLNDWLKLGIRHRNSVFWDFESAGGGGGGVHPDYTSLLSFKFTTSLLKIFNEAQVNLFLGTRIYPESNH